MAIEQETEALEALTSLEALQRVLEAQPRNHPIEAGDTAALLAVCIKQVRRALPLEHSEL